jgi:hypothetical protein
VAIRNHNAHQLESTTHDHADDEAYLSATTTFSRSNRDGETYSYV